MYRPRSKILTAVFQQTVAHPAKRLMIDGLLMLISLLSVVVISMAVPSTAYGASPHAISRTYAANPNHFKFISVNGRAVAEAITPCNMENGLIACALTKLKLVNGEVQGINDDYDNVQVFLYPDVEQPNTAVVIATKSGLLDDSVSAERYRVSFKLVDSNSARPQWKLVQFGAQIKCARGADSGKWTTERCP